MAHVTKAANGGVEADADIEIVDSHHHLWDRPGFPYLLPQILEDLAGAHRVTQTVFIQCNAMLRAGADPSEAVLGETEFANGIAAMSASGQYGPARVAAGIVGAADLKRGAAVRQVLENHCRIAGHRFRGIRHITAWDEAASLAIPGYDWQRGLLGTPAFRAGCDVLGQMDLSLDALVYFHQLAELAELARACPATRIVVNHIGLPLGIGPYAERRDEVLETWRSGLADLSACPNAFMKIGGFGTPFFGQDVKPAGISASGLAEAWRPYVETVVELFGVDRCMVESNFPVDRALCSYGDIWEAFKLLTRSWSGDERQALFAGTARSFYKLQA